MSGSRKWMLYTADDNNQYAVNIDESNGEAAGFDDFNGADSTGQVPGLLPKGFEMRYVNVRNPENGSGRKIWVGKKDNGLATGSVVSILLAVFSTANPIAAALSFAIASFISEKQPSLRPTAADTGYTDGDAT